MRRIVSALIAFMTVAGAWAAQIDASANVTGITLSLIDLNPSDALTPFVHFESADTSIAATFLINNPPQVSSNNTFGFGPFGAVSSSQSIGSGLLAQSSLSGDAFGSGALIETEARASLGGIVQEAVATLVFAQNDFVLGPYSELALSGTFHAATHADRPKLDRSFASIDFYVFAAGKLQAFDDFIKTGADGSGDFEPDRTVEESFSIAISNSSAEAVDGRLFGVVQSTAIEIPEAPAHMMLVSGLLVLTAISERLPKKIAGRRRVSEPSWRDWIKNPGLSLV